MTEQTYILGIDQGTTSSRAVVFDAEAAPVAMAQIEFPQIFPADAWVEHDPVDLWQTSVAAAREAMERADIEAGQVASIGITNQRETTLVWDRKSGQTIHNAIVWQDRRTAEQCAELRRAGLADPIHKKTGLIIDPYFSGTKIAWILDHVDGAREAAERGDLAFGTVDSFLLWRLTGGKVHATDATNASRTMLFDICKQDWDDELLDTVGVPRAMLPEVLDCTAEFGVTEPDLLGGAIAIGGVAGDQQAATIGQACFEPGMVKSTYGTGCFVVANTGRDVMLSDNRLLSTVAYRLNGKTTYALEGSIFVAGAAVQWMRDKLGLFGSARDTEDLAASVPTSAGVYLVPAFTGLGAPYWDADARGALIGLTRDTSRAHIVHAALDAVCFQTRDLMDAMAADGAHPDALRVDGGMTANNWLMQHLADLLGKSVERPEVGETTVLGAAYLAGLSCGMFASLDDIAGRWRRDARFDPALDIESRESRYAGWQRAVGRVLTK
jgi:glycerol kinase